MKNSNVHLKSISLCYVFTQRYFILEKGVIVYGKSGWDLARGKVHGTLDAGLSVITTKSRDGRIDIDAEDCIYHLKVKFKSISQSQIILESFQRKKP